MSDKRHFQWFLANWCLESAGAKHNLASQIKTARKLGTGLDLVPVEKLGIVEAADIPRGSILPDMGTDSKDKQILPFVPGLNNNGQKKRVVTSIHKAIDDAAENGIKFVMTFTGMALRSVSRNDQFGRIVDGLTEPCFGFEQSLVDHAAEAGVVLLMEALNTVGDEKTWRGHPGYLGNQTVELVENVLEKVGSRSLGLVYDVYHSKMMGECVLDVIEDCCEWIDYVHVAGVVGQPTAKNSRSELNLPDQKIDYPEVMAKLAEVLSIRTPVLLEYIPTKTGLASVEADLKAAIELCESQTSA